MAAQLGDARREGADDRHQRVGRDPFAARITPAVLAVEGAAVADGVVVFAQGDVELTGQRGHDRRCRFAAMDVLVGVEVGGQTTGEELEALDLRPHLLGDGVG